MKITLLLVAMLLPLGLQADPPRGLRPPTNQAKVDAKNKDYKVDSHWWDGWEKRTSLVTGKSQYRLIGGPWLDTKEDFYRAWDERAAANHRAFASLNEYNDELSVNMKTQQGQTQQAYAKPLPQAPVPSTRIQQPTTTLKHVETTYVLPSGKEVNQQTHYVVDGPNGVVAVPRNPPKPADLLKTK